MRFISLSSSSQFGNAYFVEGPQGSRILIDCGIRLQRLEKILHSLQIDPRSIQGILLTHEHHDHSAALKIRIPFPQRYGIPVYAPAGLWSVMHQSMGILDACLSRRIPRKGTLRVGEFYITSFQKSHDAVEPVGFQIRTRTTQLAVVTDLGWVSDAIIQRLQGIEYLIFESNYDESLELNSGRPYPLIQRVMGKQGHLSNQQSAQALKRIVNQDTRGILLAHLSIDCNQPELALDTVQTELRQVGYQGTLAAAPADQPSAWISGRIS